MKTKNSSEWTRKKGFNFKKIKKITQGVTDNYEMFKYFYTFKLKVVLKVTSEPLRINTKSEHETPL